MCGKKIPIKKIFLRFTKKMFQNGFSLSKIDISHGSCRNQQYQITSKINRHITKAKIYEVGSKPIKIMKHVSETKYMRQNPMPSKIMRHCCKEE